MTRLFVDSVLQASGTVVFSGDEYHYLSKVRRHKIGDGVEVVDTGGNRFDAKIQQIDSKTATVQLLGSLPKAPKAWPLHLLVAVPKKALFDDIVRKVNELGVSRITPVIAKRTVVSPSANKVARWRKIAEESVRQCGRRFPIQVDEPVSLTEAVSLAQSKNRMVLHPDEAAEPLVQVAQSMIPQPAMTAQSMTAQSMTEHSMAEQAIVAAIGPEGGFTDEEVSLLVQSGYQTANFGPFILRTETAAISVAAVVVSLMCTGWE